MDAPGTCSGVELIAVAVRGEEKSGTKGWCLGFWPELLHGWNSVLRQALEEIQGIEFPDTQNLKKNYLPCTFA